MKHDVAWWRLKLESTSIVLREDGLKQANLGVTKKHWEKYCAAMPAENQSRFRQESS